MGIKEYGSSRIAKIGYTTTTDDNSYDRRNWYIAGQRLVKIFEN